VSVTAGVGAGILHVTVSTWHPAAWLKFTQAFKPLAMQRWYSAEKSAAVITAGCDPVQAGFSPRASPLTTLAHVGEPREVEGRGEVLNSWYPAGPADSPATPGRGRRGGMGVRGELTAMLPGQEGRTSPDEG
jgi:hypothetical protein